MYFALSVAALTALGSASTLSAQEEVPPPALYSPEEAMRQMEKTFDKREEPSNSIPPPARSSNEPEDHPQIRIIEESAAPETPQASAKKSLPALSATPVIADVPSGPLVRRRQASRVKKFLRKEFGGWAGSQRAMALGVLAAIPIGVFSGFAVAAASAPAWGVLAGIGVFWASILLLAPLIAMGIRSLVNWAWQ